MKPRFNVANFPSCVNGVFYQGTNAFEFHIRPMNVM